MSIMHSYSRPRITLSLTCFILCAAVFSQGYALPAIDLRNLDGERVETEKILSSDAPVLMVFLELSGKDCCQQMETLIEVKKENFSDEELKLVGIYVANNGCISVIKPYVHGRNWRAEFYIDMNGELERAMNIHSEPYTILFDRNMNVVCRYEGYCGGAEDMICEKVRHCLANEESISSTL